MSGLYLPGMEMPTSPVMFCIHPDGKVFADLEGRWRECKAVPVPEHGRLIEESKVLDIVFEWCPDDDGSVGKVGDLREMLDEIEALPTIIPAELFGKTEQLADGEETE